MNIPTEAIEAAAKWMIIWKGWNPEGSGQGNMYRNEARAILEAAAPLIAAQALRDEAARLVPGANVCPSMNGWFFIDQLRARADQIEATA